MSRCNHEWAPLIQLPADMTSAQRLAIGFGLAMSHLADYDRCHLCGRLSHVRSRSGRKLLSCDTGPIERRAAELQGWITEQMKTPDGLSKAPCTMAPHPEPGAPAEAGTE